MNWNPFRKSAPPPATPRDREGRFVSEHRNRVMETVRKLRAEMPHKTWKHNL